MKTEKIETTQSSGHSSELTALLSAQRQIKTLERRLDAIHIAIADHETKLGAVRAACPSTAAMEEERRRLLAAAALGEITPAECGKREAELSARASAIQAEAEAADKQIGRLDVALSGLRTQLQRDEELLQSARDSRSEALAQFLLAEAERLGKDYLEHAEQLRDLFGRLVALDELHRAAAKRQRGAIRGSEWNRIFLPTFYLKAHEGADHPNWRGAFLRDVLISDCLDDAGNAERARLQEMGVEVI
jgi:predicted  nucleic acid-binding Zn-ribbon protein